VCGQGHVDRKQSWQIQLIVMRDSRKQGVVSYETDFPNYNLIGFVCEYRVSEVLVLHVVDTE